MSHTLEYRAASAGRYSFGKQAYMAELADALDLGSSGHPRAGSSPVIRIKDPEGTFPAEMFLRIFFCLFFR